MKILSPLSGFLVWGSGKGTWNPQGIWLWRPVGFDYRTSTGLGKTETPFWEGTNKILCVPSKSGVSVSPSSMEVLQSNPTGLQSQIPWGFLVALLDLQAGNPDVGLRTFTTVGELLCYYYSPVCGLPTWWVWDLSSLCPSYHLIAVSPLSLDKGYLFLVGSSILLSIVVHKLQFWCSHRRRWVHILLFCHLESISKAE